ncbi:MAG: hypothetical protein ABJX32_16630 [Tateyamaria sp.]|uniref:hypothetical protein n=1 Tax=Tateyamaria sp. TaxID=1929288 RepID=UPI00329CA133
MLQRKELKRDRMSGFQYVIAGGAPNQPLVCIKSHVFWSVDPDYWGPWLQPQIITPHVEWFAAKDHGALRDWIEDDLEAWRAEVSSRRSVPINIAVETSQAPAAFDLFMPLQGSHTRLDALRLVGGDNNPLIAARTVDAGQTVVGARWLVSWFDSQVAKQEPQDMRCQRPFVPDRIIMSFANFMDGGPPLMTADELRAAMSAAERLVKRAAGTTDTEALLALSADEVVAATVMLSLLAARQMVPSATYNAGQTHGYDPNAPRPKLRRGAGA